VKPYLWRLPPHKSSVRASTLTGERFPRRKHLTVHSCHGNCWWFFPDYTSQHLDSVDYAAAFALNLRVHYGLKSVDCIVCFDHSSSFLCSAYSWYSGVQTSVCSARFGFGRRTSCALALETVVNVSKCFLSHHPPLPAVCLRSLRLPVLFLSLRTKVRAECNSGSSHR